MTMLMTESNFHSLDHNDNTKKKRRIVESTDTTTMIFNPVSQQFNKPNMVAPDFNCAAVVNNASIRIQLSNLLFKYKAVVLFFYEADFASTAVKDINLINENFDRFQSLDSIPIAMSTDTDISHQNFIQQSFPTAPLFPLAADVTRSVSRHFNVVNAGSLQRTAFIIDKTRQVRFSFIVEDDRLNHSMHTICNILQTL